jgi:outer membrane protein assembly factor BamB
MNDKPWLLLLLIVAFLAASCGPQGVTATATAVPSPSGLPVVEGAPSATPAQVVPVPGTGVLMTIGQQGSGDGEFINPQGLALDEQGNIYVADTGNARLQILDPQGNLLLAIADERLTAPRYVALDDAGRIYVSDTSERVHVFSARGDPLQSFGQPGSLPSQFSGIADLAVNAQGQLYVVDSGNSRVQTFSLLSGLLFTFGDEGDPAELLSRPEGIALDAEGSVYVSDAGNNRVRKHAPGGTFLRSLGAQISEPREIDFDQQGNIYVTDGDRGLIQVLDTQGHLLWELGEGQLDDPWGVAVDEEGRVFVADSGNHRLVVFAPAEEIPPPVPTSTPEAPPTSRVSATPLLPPIGGPPPWPMYGGDAQHTGRSLAEGPAEPSLKWMFRVGILANSPALGTDGSVYFGSLDGNLYALDADGTEAWRAPFGQISGVPAIGAEGTIYAGVASPVEEMFYAFNRDGSLGWGYHIESHIVEGSAIVGPDGTIYLAASNPQTAGGAVIALNLDGGEKWRYEVGSRIPFSPALGHDGTVYVGARNGNLYALNPDGTRKWQKSVGTVRTSPAVGPEGVIYLGTGPSYLALSPVDGSQTWTFSPAHGEADSTPAVGRGGRVYLTSSSNELYALNPDGTLIWTFSAEEEEEREVHFSSSITLDGGRVLYVGTREGELFAVNPGGSLRWRFPLREGGTVLVGPAIGNDGTLYVGAGSNLYAVGP